MIRDSSKFLPAVFGVQKSMPSKFRATPFGM